MKKLGLTESVNQVLANNVNEAKNPANIPKGIPIIPKIKASK